MDKQAFLSCLEQGLAGLPRDEAAERLAFYSEMIDDRVEDGLTEEAAVAELGSVDRIVDQIVAEIPLPKLVKERVLPGKRLRTWEIVLLVLGAPLWLPLLLAAGAILLSVYLVIWAVVLCLWAVELSLAAGAVSGVAAGILLMIRGDGLRAVALIGAGAILAGLTIFLFYGFLAVSRGAVILTKRVALWVKSRFVRKENRK